MAMRRVEIEEDSQPQAFTFDDDEAARALDTRHAPLKEARRCARVAAQQ
jgi:hypothetical protein